MKKEEQSASRDLPPGDFAVGGDALSTSSASTDNTALRYNSNSQNTSRLGSRPTPHVVARAVQGAGRRGCRRADQRADAGGRRGARRAAPPRASPAYRGPRDAATRATREDRSLYSPKARERQHTHQGPADELARRQLTPATAVDRDGGVVA